MAARERYAGLTGDQPCKHVPERLYAWVAYDGTLCVCCCDCGAVLKGAADQEDQGGED